MYKLINMMRGLLASSSSAASSTSRTTAWRRAGAPCKFWHQARHVAGAAVAGKTLMIVESPTKAKKIQKFLGGDYEVMASYGHIKDLPAKQGSVLPDKGFAMQWQTSSKSAQHVKELAAAAKKASRLILATDPDREGEAISWHVLQELQSQRAINPSTPVERVTFTEVTKKAVTQALQQPRQISDALVNAYLARRGLDYLMGFHLSPLLWRKLSGAKSAGRVQSVALRLLCEREVQVEQFEPQEYWSIEMSLQLGSKQQGQLPARLLELDGAKVQYLSISSEDQAQQVAARISSSTFQVSSTNSKAYSRNPAPPFVTSTLQQEANKRFGWSTQRTMSVAQQLYEGPPGTSEGLITYTRTDGYFIAEDALAAIRGHIQQRFGPEYMPELPRRYSSKAKNSQEAHEAIRPANVAITPDSLPAALDADHRRLYRLIWQRTVAYQMASAKFCQVSIDFASQDSSITLRSSGSMPTFDGYQLVYSEQSQQQQEESEQQGQAGTGALQVQQLAQLQQGQQVALQSVQPQQHFTKPPGRFSEGSLVKQLEELGIGRPSTYASTIKTLQSRGYVGKEGSALVPSSLGRVVCAFLEAYFREYVDYAFTSGMEQRLDDISAGRADWQQVLSSFWHPFQEVVAGMGGISVAQVFDTLDTALDPFFFPQKAGQPDPRACPQCGSRLAIKPARSQGAFIGCSSYSADDDAVGRCDYSRPLVAADAEQLAGLTSSGRHLGDDPATGKPVFAKLGPFGGYVQLGEDVPKAGAAAEAAAAPKRASLPKKLSLADVTLGAALQLLSLPRELGMHPQLQLPVVANVGRFGPYVKCGAVLASLPKGVGVQEVGLDAAVELISQKRERMIAKGEDPDAVPAKASRSRTAAGKAAAKAKVAKAVKASVEKPAAGKAATKAKAKAVKASAKKPAAGKAAAKAAKASVEKPAGGKTATKVKAKAVKASVKKPAAGKAATKTATKARVEQPAAGGSKRAPSAYLLFCQQQRLAYKARGLQASPQEVMKMLAADWKALPEEERQRCAVAQLAGQQQPAGVLVAVSS